MNITNKLTKTRMRISFQTEASSGKHRLLK